MRSLFKAALAALCILASAGVAQAQYTNVTAGHIYMSSVLIPAGTVTLTPVGDNGRALPFVQGGNGLNAPTAFQCSILNGAITGTCQVPDASLTTPANIRYSIQVTNTASGKSFILPSVQNVSGASWALDAYATPANLSNVQPIQVSYGSAAPPSPCVSPSFYIQKGGFGTLYMCVEGLPVKVTGASGGGTGGNGDPGEAATIVVGSVTSLPAGSTPTIVNVGTENAAVFNFGIPAGAQGTQGLKGDKGDQGDTGATGSQGQTGQTGQQGTPGAAATVSVGSVQTGAAGTSAIVSNAGTSNAAVLNFTIPQGSQGLKGDQGDKGDTGAQGLSGGSTTWLGAWSSSTTYVLDDAVSFNGSSYISLASNTNVTPGTNPADWQLLAQKGDTGATGATGLKGDTGDQGTPGVKGDQGIQGDKGDTGSTGTPGTPGTTGTAATVTVGTVTPLAPGSMPTVTNSGDSSNAVFDFGLPQSLEGADFTANAVFPVGVCQGTTASTGFSLPPNNAPIPMCATGTNTNLATLHFASGALNTAQAHFPLPIDADCTKPIAISYKWRAASTAGNVTWGLSTLFVPDASLLDQAYNTASGVTVTPQSTTLDLETSAISSVTKTGCQAGNELFVKVLRHGDTDTMTGDAELVSLNLLYSRTGGNGGTVGSTGFPFVLGATDVEGGASVGTSGSPVANLNLSNPSISGTVAGTAVVPNAALVNTTIIINGVTCTLGSTCTISGGGAPATPTFKQYTYVADQGSSLDFITSPEITVALNDLIVVSCRYAGVSPGASASSTSVATFNALASQAFTDLGAATAIQMSWGIVATAGPSTFTCSQESAGAGMSMVVLDYSGTGTTANVSVGTTGTSFPDITSPLFTTTQRTLDIMCTAVNSISFAFTADSIGGNPATLRGVSGPTLETAIVDQGCEDFTATAAATDAVGIINYPTYNPNVSTQTVLTINY